MLKIKVMIAEDERLAREELEYLLSKVEDLELCPSAATGSELLEYYDLHGPDVVFLDIEMPELEGITAAQELRKKEPQPLLIFTTAYDEYAVEAFRLHATDYLLKPFSAEQLEEALLRARNRLQERTFRTSVGTNNKGMSKLILDDGDRLNVIDPKTILYASKDERIVQIYTKEQHYATKLTLQELEEKLRPFHFFRCHRSYLVNLEYIKEIVPWFNGAYNIHLHYADSVNIPVSRSSAKDLFQALGM